MTKDVQIIVINDYNVYIPIIEVIRTCQLDESHEVIYSSGDNCLIKAITTSRAFMNENTKKDLITYVKSTYFRQTYGCKFEVDLTLVES